MSFSNNPYGVLENKKDSSEWCTVETRKQRRSRKNLAVPQIPLTVPQIPKSGFELKLEKSFTEQRLEEVLEKVEEIKPMVTETKEIVKPIEAENEKGNELNLKGEELEAEINVKKSEQDKKPMEMEEDEEHKSEHIGMEPLVEQEHSPKEDESEEEVELDQEDRESTPEKKTLAQTLAEQSKAFDLTSIDGVELIVEWCTNICKEGEEGEKYRAAFNNSVILNTIVRCLVTTPYQKVYGKEKIIELFHHILQGNHVYHGWLYNQIERLAVFISKTACRTNIQWLSSLSNQTFALLEAQKKPSKGLQQNIPEIAYELPSSYIMTDSDSKLKLQCDQSDGMCQEMWKSLNAIRIKDSELMSMNPTASVGFKNRYTNIQSQAQANITKLRSLMTAQTDQLEKIRKRFQTNEHRTKELIQPIDIQLKGVTLSCEQTKNEILEYESRLKSARAKLCEQEALGALLKDQLTKTKAASHPEKADLIKLHNTYQFNLDSVKRKEHCYTHLGHIASESHKHLESWSSCRINQQRDSRTALLQQFYGSAAKYICTLLSMLNFLKQRVEFMKQTLQRSQSDYNQRKQFFGDSHSPIEKCIAADQESMNLDLTMIKRLQDEIKNILQTCFDLAVKWGSIEPAFNDFWQNVQSFGVLYEINMKEFVNIKTSSPPITTHPSDNGAVQRSTQTQYQFKDQQHSGISRSIPSTEQQYQPRESTHAEHWRQTSHSNGPSHIIPRNHPQGHQSLPQEMQENKYQKHAQASVQGKSGQPESHAQSGDQQPLKIINNATTEAYDLHQRHRRTHYQTEPTSNHTPANLKGSKQAAQTPDQALGNNMQDYRRRSRNNRRRRPPSNSKFSGERPVMGW